MATISDVIAEKQARIAAIHGEIAAIEKELADAAVAVAALNLSPATRVLPPQRSRACSGGGRMLFAADGPVDEDGRVVCAVCEKRVRVNRAGLIASHGFKWRR